MTKIKVCTILSVTKETSYKKEGGRFHQKHKVLNLSDAGVPEPS